MLSAHGLPLAGYAHPAYAQALAEFGEPLRLERCGGSLLRRPIAGHFGHDAMGCYPLFCCDDWSALGDDLAVLGEDLVSVVMVIDPFGSVGVEQLKEWFPDHLVVFKQHFIVDLAHWRAVRLGRHHRRNVRRGLARVAVHEVPEPIDALSEWDDLYAGLIARHAVLGVAAFTRESFARQLLVPGVVVLRATAGDQTVGMTLWYASAGVAYWHLSAYSEAGYRLDASYALMWSAVERFAESGEHWLNLGGNAGPTADESSGLSYFKRGWSTGTRPAYLCGRVLNRHRYDAAAALGGPSTTDFFPAYRANEQR